MARISVRSWKMKMNPSGWPARSWSVRDRDAQEDLPRLRRAEPALEPEPPLRHEDPARLLQEGEDRGRTARRSRLPCTSACPRRRISDPPRFMKCTRPLRSVVMRPLLMDSTMFSLSAWSRATAPRRSVSSSPWTRRRSERYDARSATATNATRCTTSPYPTRPGSGPTERSGTSPNGTHLAPEHEQRRVEEPASRSHEEPAPPVQDHGRDGDGEEVEERHGAVHAARDPDERGDEDRVPDELDLEEGHGAGQPPVEAGVEEDHPVRRRREEEERSERLARSDQQLDGERGDQQGRDDHDPQDHQPS